MIEESSYSLKGKSVETCNKRKKDLDFWAHLTPFELGIDSFENVSPNYKLLSETQIKTEYCKQEKNIEDQIEMKYDIKSESLALPVDTDFKCLISNQCADFKCLICEELKFEVNENNANCGYAYCDTNVEDDKFAIPVCCDAIREIKIILTDINTLKLNNNDEASGLTVEHNEIYDCKNMKDIIFMPENIFIEKIDDHESERRFLVKDSEVSTKPVGVPLHRVEDSVSFLNNLGLRPVWKNQNLFKSPARAKRLSKLRRNINKQT